MSERISTSGFIIAYTSHSAALFDDGVETMEITWDVKMITGVEEWLQQNMAGRYTVDDKYFYFEDEADAVAFKLRWV